MIDAKAADAVLSRITEPDLVELALHITSVPAPPGEEGPGAEVIYQWLDAEGFAPRRVGLFEDRFNVFAEVPAQGRGPALAFNSHIDTWMHPGDHLIWRDPGQPDYHVGRAEGDLLIGNPVVKWLVLQNPEVCMLYLDIRTVPGQDGGAIRHELRDLLDELSLDGTVDQFVDRPGYEAHGIEPLSDAVDEAHRFEFDDDCQIATPPECSMWRDHNVFNEAGIPALTYGPPGVAGAGTFAVRKDDLLRCSRVYALTALAMCARG